MGLYEPHTTEAQDRHEQSHVFQSHLLVTDKDTVMWVEGASGETAGPRET